MDNTQLWLWLSQGLGPCVDWHGLWEQYGDIRAIWEDRLYLLQRGLLTVRQSDRLLTTKISEMQQRLEQHRQKNIQILTWEQESYPAQLRAIDSPPPVLYVKGNPACLQNLLMLGVVGTRHPSAYGVEATHAICKGLAAAGAVIVSGLAEGLDSEAHKTALRAGTPTVGVLGTDLEKVFPAKNRELQNLVAQSGAIVSEYPCTDEGDRPRYKESFVQRNRIIAGLVQGLCVAEARGRSGTMSTVRFAMDYGRDVFAVPGSIFSPLSEGTNQLLKEGAKPVTNAQDVLEEYNLQIALPQPEQPSAVPAEPLAGEMAAVYAALPAAGSSIEMAELSSATGIPTGMLMSLLTRLEMRGYVRQLPGRRFEKAV